MITFPHYEGGSLPKCYDGIGSNYSKDAMNKKKKISIWRRLGGQVLISSRELIVPNLP